MSDQAERPWPNGARAWWIVSMLLVAYTFSFVDRIILSLLIGPIQNELRIDDTQVSLLLGIAFSIFFAAVGLPCAFIADRWNRKRLISAGITIWSMMTVLSALARSFGGLFAFRMGVGVGEAVLTPTAYSMLADLFPKHKLGRALAVFALGTTVGSGLALVGGGMVVKAVSTMPSFSIPLLGQFAPWRMTLLCVGLPGLIVALLILVTVREPVRRVIAPPRTELQWTDALEVFSFVNQRRMAFLPMMLAASLVGMVMFGYIAWAPTMFSRSFGMTPAEASLPLGLVFGICGSVGILAGGATVDALFRRGVAGAHALTILGALLIATVCLTIAPLMPTPTLVFVMLGIGLAAGMSQSAVLPAALQMMSPNHLRAQVSALYLLIQNLISMGLGPTVIALLTDYTFQDPSALRYSMALVAVVGMVIATALMGIGVKPVTAAMRGHLPKG